MIFADLFATREAGMKRILIRNTSLSCVWLGQQKINF